jgi:hypothetical protein
MCAVSRLFLGCPSSLPSLLYKPFTYPPLYIASLSGMKPFSVCFAEFWKRKLRWSFCRNVSQILVHIWATVWAVHIVHVATWRFLNLYQCNGQATIQPRKAYSWKLRPYKCNAKALKISWHNVKITRLHGSLNGRNKEKDYICSFINPLRPCGYHMYHQV